MARKPLDVAALRQMADTMLDFDFTDEELERILPHVQRYQASMEQIAHIDLTSIEPESLRGTYFLKEQETER